MTEKQIQNSIFRLFATWPDIRLWRANAGGAKFGRHFVRFGIPGQADITGILSDGRRVEIEVKRPGAKQSEAQKSYQAMIERFNGVYILAQSPEDVARGLARAGISRESKKT